MHDDGPSDEIEALSRQLARDVPLPADLWPQIEPRLVAPQPENPSTLESLARQLQAESAPPVDLWPGIAARLTPRRANVLRSRVAAIAAAASLAIAAALLALVVQAPRPEPQSADAGNEPARPASSLAMAWMLETPAVDPAVAAELARNLELVQNERLAIESAMDIAPDNLLLRELWGQIYATELALNDTLGRTIMIYQRGQTI
jgi:hypothetical protein